MKKKLVIIFICFIIFLEIIIFCVNKNEMEKNEKLDNEIKEDGVTLILKENTLTPMGAVFIIKNNTDYVYKYGPEYVIEIKKDNDWEEIKLEYPLSWNAIIYELDSKQSREINIDFTQGYGKLNSGKYRLVKTVYKKLNEYIDNSNVQKIYAEFEIE